MISCLMLAMICARICSGANILALFPSPSYSHTHGYLPIMEELARRGHNVTVVSPYPRKQPLANYTDVHIPFNITQLMNKVRSMGKEVESVFISSFLSNVKGMSQYCPQFEEIIIKNSSVMHSFIREDRSHFDVIITESFYCQEALTALSHKYNAHLVGVTTFDLSSMEAYYTGNTIPYCYIPHVKTSFSDRMNFIERLETTIFYLSELFLNLYVHGLRKEKFMRENIIFPGSENLPPLDDILRNHSLILVDRHFSLSYPRPYHQNIVEFGGFPVKKPEPLSKDLEEFMSEAKDGVIYLSWGSMYKSTNMHPKTLAKFLSVFSKLKQRVLVKWENPILPGKPENVKIAPWYPQSSILAHPKLVAFISHCGFHGFGEATYFGVPILGTPVFSDQFRNIKIAEKYGYGIFLDLSSFSEEYLKESLEKLIYNSSYKEAALRRSAVMKDRPLPPLDNAVYWIEYVLRHNGARHLRPASLDIPWYQYFLLDIVGVLLLVLLLPLTVLISLCRFYFWCGTSKQSKTLKEE